MAFVPDFKIVHVGINCENSQEAGQCAHMFEQLFQLAVNPQKESDSACFTGTEIEWMKKPGKGTHGHIAVATKDLPAARAFLEEQGVQFDESSIKYFPDGRILVIYLKEEIGGFAVHLMQS